MSPTMVVSSTTTTFLTGRLSCCPSCGFDILPPENDPCTQLLESQARIVELETQVCLLNQRLRAHLAAPRNSSSSSSSSSTSANTTTTAATTAGQQSPTPSPRPVRGSLFQSGASRISALVYNRASRTPPRTTTSSTTTNIPAAAAVETKTAPAPPTSPTPTPKPKHAATTTSTTSSSSSEVDTLLEALERETSLRRAAETRLNATSKEVEELSAALFEQANEMVADERRARAKLEQRVGELEKRDEDKKRRLDRLETAVVRIERARNLLLEGPEGCVAGGETG